MWEVERRAIRSRYKLNEAVPWKSVKAPAGVGTPCDCSEGVGGGAGQWPGMGLGLGLGQGRAVLKTPNIFRKTAPKDHQPPTANRRQPPTAINRHRHQPPTAPNRQPPTIVRYCFCGLLSCPCLDHEAESVPVNVRFCWRNEPSSPPLPFKDSPGAGAVAGHTLKGGNVPPPTCPNSSRRLSLDPRGRPVRISDPPPPPDPPKIFEPVLLQFEILGARVGAKGAEFFFFWPFLRGYLFLSYGLYSKYSEFCGEFKNV